MTSESDGTLLLLTIPASYGLIRFLARDVDRCYYAEHLKIEFSLSFARDHSHQVLIDKSNLVEAVMHWDVRP